MPELVISPVPSRLLLAFISGTHLCAACVLLLVPGLEFYWRILLLCAVGLSAFYCLMLHGGFWAVHTVETLYWREFGGWELVNGMNQALPVILLNNSFSALPLSVLNFKTRRALGKQRYTVILLPDNCPLALRRQLRKRMKLYQAKA